MRLRTIILLLALFAFLTATVGGLLYYHSYRKAAFQKAEADAQAQLTLLTDQLSSHLSEHVKTARVLAGLEELRAVLETPQLDRLYAANRILDDFTAALEVQVCYLMDSEGVTLCSSNRNAADSFVGYDFSFRPYFTEAAAGRPATYLALGSTSLRRGIYYAHPVYDDDGRAVIGVAVIKASVEYVENQLFAESRHPLLFVDPHGVIFITNQDTLRFHTLWDLTNDELAAIEASKQFGHGPWTWSGFTRTPDADVIDRAGRRYQATSLDVSSYPGWRIISLRSYDEIHRQVSAPFVRVLGPVVYAVLLLTGLLVAVLYRMGVGEVSRRKHAEKELRLSEERYRRIYNKTPVMLHSIDPQGCLVRVSDHWLAVMGYERDEVIGQPLTDFFTTESKERALNEVFPRFFATGSCQDIPYTYITRSGRTIDTLLSCYGERNEEGRITRSLAVSVDVTEKNRAQAALEVAKEQLSEYSHDLERRVQRRTAQLERAQANLKNLSKNIIASQEREKAQVARELHDHLGQVLTALRIDAVWAEKDLARGDESAERRARRMSELIDQTIDEVRDMAYRLRPRVLDDLGLADALDSLVSDFEKRSNVSCVFNQEAIPEISDTLATAFYRIAQEAVTNALRHSGATTVLVELKPGAGGIELVIQDNGCGFALTDESEFSGFGIAGMKERANLVACNLDIDSQPGTGTTIRCTAKV